MRNGNFFYQLTLDGPVYLVHRGVSQGGKKLSPEARERWWEKKNEPLPQGLEFATSGQGQVVVKITAVALRAIHEQKLVLVCDASSPQVWTPKRIVARAEKVRLMV